MRHGTLCQIANFDVATGKVVAPSIGPTHKEENFVAHIDNSIQTDPQAPWIFITDQLNTHTSAGLVELVARHCGAPKDLGVKHCHGILKSMATRRATVPGSIKSRSGSRS